MSLDNTLKEFKLFAECGCHACESCQLFSQAECPHLSDAREIVRILEYQNRDRRIKPNEGWIYGYRVDDLIRVATLMENCDVKPEEIKRLSDNLILLYGVVMRGIQKEVKASADRVLIECRYPGYVDVVRMIEEEKNAIT